MTPARSGLEALLDLVLEMDVCSARHRPALAWRPAPVGAVVHRSSGHDDGGSTHGSDARLSRWLAVPVGTTVLQRARVQGVVGEPPIQTATTWVIMDVVNELPILREVNTGPGGIYSRLEELDYQIMFEEVVTCRLPRADEQETLQIRDDQPVLTLWRRAYDQNERIVEVTHRVVVGDRHELIYRYGSGA